MCVRANFLKFAKLLLTNTLSRFAFYLTSVPVVPLPLAHTALVPPHIIGFLHLLS